jgi:plastocyanin
LAQLKIHYLIFGIVFLAVSLACRLSLLPEDSPRNGSREIEVSTTIHVVVEDFSFSLDASQAPAGTVAFAVINNGSMRHDFAISGNGIEKKTSIIRSGGRDTLVVDLDPGTYTYFCTVKGHDKLGMSGIFTVISN